MYEFKIKFYYGGPDGKSHAECPILNRNAGSLTSLLDAVLVNGWGEKTVTSISVDMNRIATLKCTSHGFEQNTRFSLIGAGEEALNGEWQVYAVVDADTLLFIAPESLVGQSFTDATMRIKVPSLGWEKAFSPSTNVAVYRARKGNRHWLYVDDSSDTDNAAIVRPYESARAAGEVWQAEGSWMAYGDSLTLTDSFNTLRPSDSVAIKKAVGWLHGWSDDIGWTIVGCDRFFYLCVKINAGTAVYMFGDFPSVIPADEKNVVLRGAGILSSSSSSYAGNAYGNYFRYGVKDTGFIAGGVNEKRQNKQFVVWSPHPLLRHNAETYTIGNYVNTDDVSDVGFVGPAYLFECGSNVYSYLRGYAPGFYQCRTHFENNQIVRDADGREYITINAKHEYSPRFMLRVSGDWFEGAAAQTP